MDRLPIAEIRVRLNRMRRAHNEAGRILMHSDADAHRIRPIFRPPNYHGSGVTIDLAFGRGPGLVVGRGPKHISHDLGRVGHPHGLD